MKLVGCPGFILEMNRDIYEESQIEKIDEKYE